jgi:uncharacterized membrane protein (UPF0127 family)
VALILALAMVACRGEERDSAEVTRANPIIPLDSGVVRIETGADTLQVNVELAETPAQKSTGLMERHFLGEAQGMLFVYDEDQAPSDPFYMFRTRIPLDIAFMDSVGEVLAIRQMQPCTSPAPEWCERYPPGVPYRSALEVNLGFFEKHGVGIGDRIVLVERSGS